MASRQKLYSVPRKLDLASLFVFTTGYGLLFALMNIANAGALNFAIVAGFFTCIGVSQAILFRGKSPRKASCLAGAVYYFAILVIAGMSYGWPLSRILEGRVIAFVLMVGTAAGYVSGASIGGVFLIADSLRTRLRSRTKLDSEDASDG